jgi:hypothetical protein
MCSEEIDVERSARTHNLVRVHNRLQAVRDSDDSHVALQLRTERRLDDRVRLVVDRGGGFIEDEALALHVRQLTCAAHVGRSGPGARSRVRAR